MKLKTVSIIAGIAGLIALIAGAAMPFVYIKDKISIKINRKLGIM